MSRSRFMPAGTSFYPYCSTCNQHYDGSEGAKRMSIRTRIYAASADAAFAYAYMDTEQLANICEEAEAKLMNGRSSTFDTSIHTVRWIHRKLAEAAVHTQPLDSVIVGGDNLPVAVEATLLRYNVLIAFVHVISNNLNEALASLKLAAGHAVRVLGVGASPSESISSPTGIASPTLQKRHRHSHDVSTISEGSISVNDLQRARQAMAMAVYVARLGLVHSSSPDLHSGFHDLLLRLLKEFRGISDIGTGESATDFTAGHINSWLIEVLQLIEDYHSQLGTGSITNAFDSLVHSWQAIQRHLPHMHAVGLGCKALAAELLLGHAEKFTGLNLSWLTAEHHTLECLKTVDLTSSPIDIAIMLLDECAAAEDVANSQLLSPTTNTLSVAETAAFMCLKSSFDVALPSRPQIRDIHSRISSALRQSGRLQEAFEFVVAQEAINIESPTSRGLSTETRLSQLFGVFSHLVEQTNVGIALWHSSDDGKHLQEAMASLRSFIVAVDGTVPLLFQPLPADIVDAPNIVIACRARALTFDVSNLTTLQTSLMACIHKALELLGDLYALSGNAKEAQCCYGWAWYVAFHSCNAFPEHFFSEIASQTEPLGAPHLMQKWIRASYYSNNISIAMAGCVAFVLALNPGSLSAIRNAWAALKALHMVTDTDGTVCLTENSLSLLFASILRPRNAQMDRGETVRSSKQSMLTCMQTLGLEDTSIMTPEQLVKSIAPDTKASADMIVQILQESLHAEPTTFLMVTTTCILSACLVEGGQDRAISISTDRLRGAEELADIAAKCFDEVVLMETSAQQVSFDAILGVTMPAVPLARLYESQDGFSINRCTLLYKASLKAPERMSWTYFCQWLAMRNELNYCFAVARRICHMTLDSVKHTTAESARHASPRLGVRRDMNVSRASKTSLLGRTSASTFSPTGQHFRQALRSPTKASMSGDIKHSPLQQHGSVREMDPAFITAIRKISLLMESTMGMQESVYKHRFATTDAKLGDTSIDAGVVDALIDAAGNTVAVKGGMEEEGITHQSELCRTLSDALHEYRRIFNTPSKR